MTVLHHLPIFKIRIDGEYAPTPMMDDVQEIVVDISLHLPEMVTIRLHDPKLEWVNHSTLLAPGKPLSIEVLKEGEAKSKIKPLAEVEISAIEPTFLGGGASSLLIRGYNRSSRLHFGRYARTFTNRSDAEIVRQIAEEIGLQADVDATGVTYEYVLQNNQTNMEFLATRAQRIGYQVYANHQKLYFKAANFRHPGQATLTLGDELHTFRPRLATQHQASSVKVFGWDSKGKQTVQAEAQPDEQQKQGGMQQSGASSTAQQFALSSFPAVVVDAPVASIDEATALANGLMQDIHYRFLEADGVCAGNPQIRAGCNVTLQGLGERFNGDYLLTTAQHIYDSRGYRVEFAVSGRQPNTLPRLLRQRNGTSHAPPERIIGVVIGLVTNLLDPDGLGRVKVKFPWLFDVDGVAIESTWAKVVNPSAGQSEKGIYFLPEIDDEVLIAFEHGDVNRPYLLGALWNSKDPPPKPNSEVVKDGKVIERITRSRRHHQLVFNDSDDKPSILIQTQSNHRILLDDTADGPLLRIETNGGHQIVLNDTPGSQSISIIDATGSNKLVIDSVKNSGLFEVLGEMTIKANGPVKINSLAMVEVQAPMIKLN